MSVHLVPSVFERPRMRMYWAFVVETSYVSKSCVRPELCPENTVDQSSNSLARVAISNSFDRLCPRPQEIFRCSTFQISPRSKNKSSGFAPPAKTESSARLPSRTLDAGNLRCDSPLAERISICSPSPVALALALALVVAAAKISANINRNRSLNFIMSATSFMGLK